MFVDGKTDAESEPKRWSGAARTIIPGRARKVPKMAESPSTMKSVENIQYLLDELVEREIHQTETLAAIQYDILAAIKGVQNAIESLHSTYRSMHEESAVTWAA